MLKEKSKKGSSLFTVVQINFLILKLTSLIDWSWIWVLSPAWIPLIILGITKLAIKSQDENE